MEAGAQTPKGGWLRAQDAVALVVELVEQLLHPQLLELVELVEELVEAAAPSWISLGRCCRG